MIEAELPDGTILEFPDGTAPEVISATAKRIMGVQEGVTPTQNAQPEEMSALQKISGLAYNMAQGRTFNTADEIGAAIAKPITYAAKNILPSSLGGEDVSYSQVSQYMDDLRKKAESDNERFLDEESIIGYGGQILGGGSLANSIQSSFPKVSNALSQFAKTSPYLASSGVGGGTGYLYALGSGEGGLQERAVEAVPTGVASAVLSPLVALGANKVIKPMVSKAGSSISSAISKVLPEEKIPSVLKQSAETVPVGTGNIAKQSGEIFSKTAGERTQKAVTQTLEADALAGRYGDDVSSYMRNARNIQNQERKDLLSAISKSGMNDTGLDEVIDRVYSRVKGNEEFLGKGVDNAYGIARQGNKVKIDAGDIRTGLMSEIGKIRREMAVNLSDSANYSKSRVIVKSLGKKISSPVANVSNVKLGDLEDWRKTLTNYASDAQGTEKAFLSQVRNAYDNFMIKTANEAAEIGDADAIKAFRNAVSLRKQYGQLFERDNIVKSVAEGKSVDDFTKDLIGSAAIGGKKNLLQNVKSIVRAAETQAKGSVSLSKSGEIEKTKADIAAAFIKKAYSRSVSGFEEGSQTVATSPAKMAKELEDLFVKNKDLADYLYGKEARMTAQRAIKELKVIASKQPSTQNPSGSGQMIARVMRDTGLTRIPFISFVNDAFESAHKSAKTSELQKGLGDFIQQKTPATSELFGKAGAVTGLTTSNVLEKE